VAEPPGEIVEGVALNKLICGTSTTSIVTSANEFPAAPNAVIVYVVVVVGETLIEPLAGTGPMPLSIETLREFDTDQISVNEEPATIRVRDAIKLMIGRLVTVTVA
jgi:hypothetical protein